VRARLSSDVSREGGWSFPGRLVHSVALLAVAVGCITLTCPVLADDNYPNGHDQVRQVQHGDTTKWRIDRPYVSRRDTEYPQITFRAGDRVEVRAGGCVQTGGSGATWKLYVSPLGNNSDRLYHGLLWIPGVTGGGLQRIAGLMSPKVFTIPSNLPPVTGSNIRLHLGYEDDDYGDNGYYRHDDGNFNQCRGVGDAWVEITITHAAIPVPPVPSYSPHVDPFDLVWKQVDANLLPLNPIWAYQIDHPGQRPSPGDACGSRIFDLPCTSQSPAFDRSEQFFEFAGVCAGSPLDGHANWMAATYEGVVKWQDHSNPTFGDDDYNFGLYRTDNSGLTQLGDGLGLEFEARETVDHFTSPWWSRFHNAVDGNGGVTPQTLANGRYAIVTGLFGIDGVHGGWSESHPVFSMAIQVGNTVLPDGRVEEHWVFFLRNWGNEGQCSHDQHYLDPAPDGHYYIQVPWAQGAVGFELVSGGTIIKGTPGVGPISFEQSPNEWVYLKASLPAGTSEPRIDGEFVLRWTPAPSGAVRLVPLPGLAAPALPELSHPEETEASFSLPLNKITDPVQRDQFRDIVVRETAVAEPTVPDAQALDVSTTINQHPTLSVDPRSVRPRRDQAQPDTRRSAENEQLKRALEGAFGPRLSRLNVADNH
jgi:hypothetical protein